MKQITFIFILLFFVLTMPLVSHAGVNINISIPAPLVFPAPPDLVVVPSGDVDIYMVPDAPGLYFYDNYWYRFDRDRWYRSHDYSGSWVYIEPDLVPGYIMDVPPDYYRHLPRGYHKIPYRDFHSHWRSWSRDRHWHRYDWYKRQHSEFESWRHEHPRPQHDLHHEHDRHDHARRDHNRNDNDRYDEGRHNNDRHDNDRYDDGKRHAKHDGKDKKIHPDDRRGMEDRY